MNVVREILAVARSLAARTRKVDERDNLESEFKEAIRDGDTVEFVYTKKDGSQKRREITPNQVFRMKGRPAVKGVEVNDRRGIEKLFYLDMIGDVAQQEDEPEPEEEIRVPSGFHVLEDEGLARSLYGIIKNQGLWKSAKQGNLILQKVSRGDVEWRGKVWKQIGDKHRGCVGLVITPLLEGSSGFHNRTVFVIDAEGVVARYSYWAKKFTKAVKFDKMEDISDDYGGMRNVPQEMWDRMRDEGRYRTDYYTSWKNGFKLKWQR